MTTRDELKAIRNIDKQVFQLLFYLILSNNNNLLSGNQEHRSR